MFPHFIFNTRLLNAPQHWLMTDFLFPPEDICICNFFMKWVFKTWSVCLTTPFQYITCQLQVWKCFCYVHSLWNRTFLALTFKEPGKGLSPGPFQKAAQPLRFWAPGMPTQNKTPHFIPGWREICLGHKTPSWMIFKMLVTFVLLTD